MQPSTSQTNGRLLLPPPPPPPPPPPLSEVLPVLIVSEVPLLAFDPNASPAFRDISDGADEWLRTRKEAQGLTVVT